MVPPAWLTSVIWPAPSSPNPLILLSMLSSVSLDAVPVISCDVVAPIPEMSLSAIRPPPLSATVPAIASVATWPV